MRTFQSTHSNFAAYLVLCSVTVLAAGSPALAAEDYRHDRNRQAVSGAHGVAGIDVDLRESGEPNKRRFAATADYNFPLPRPLPAQLGLNIGGSFGLGLAGNDVDEALGALGALFWRDSTLAFGGIAATYDRFDPFDRASLSGFAGGYLGDFDVTGTAGFEGGNGVDRAIFSAEAGWYLNSQTRLGAEVVAGTRHRILGEGHIDWQP
jgi:hypothetical protein